MTMRFTVNNPEVINETIDGESVMINLRTGNYYSLTGSGADVWAAIECTASAPEIVDHLCQRYGAPRDRVEADVQRLLAELRAEDLVVPANGDGAQRLPDGRTHGDPYEPPALEKYTDMQDLILLDPVHEVDDRGWPHAGPDGMRDVS